MVDLDCNTTVPFNYSVTKIIKIKKNKKIYIHKCKVKLVYGLCLHQHFTTKQTFPKGHYFPASYVISGASPDKLN